MRGFVDLRIIFGVAKMKTTIRALLQVSLNI